MKRSHWPHRAHFPVRPLRKRPNASSAQTIFVDADEIVEMSFLADAPGYPELRIDVRATGPAAIDVTVTFGEDQDQDEDEDEDNRCDGDED